MVSSSAPVPAVVDLRSLAQSAQALEGMAPLASFERLMSDLPPLAEAGLSADAAFQWRAQAEWREPLPHSLPQDIKGGVASQPQLWLHLSVQGRVPQTCQRCLAPYAEPVVVDRWFRFVADENMALAEDDDSEEDLLVFEPRFDLRSLVEDELLMALPLVPMHETCPRPLPMSAGEAELSTVPEHPNPFAALAALKEGRKPT